MGFLRWGLRGRRERRQKSVLVISKLQLMSFLIQKIKTEQRISSSNLLLPSKSDLFMLSKSNISSAKESSLIEWKYITFEALECLMNFLSLLVATALNLIDVGKSLFSLRICLSLFAGCSVVFNYFSIKNDQELVNKIKNNMYPSQAKHIPRVILTTCLLAIHPNVFCEGLLVTIGSATYEVNKLLSIFIYVRIVLILIFFLKISRFFGLRVSRILEIYGVEHNINIKYTIKCLLTENGVKYSVFLTCMAVLIIPFISYCLFSSPEIEVQYLSLVYDMVITMTTVGYGDLNHDTPISRATSAAIIILGAFLSSLLTLTFLKFFSLNEQERKAFEMLKRLNSRDLIRKEKQYLVEKTCKHIFKLERIPADDRRKKSQDVSEFVLKTKRRDNKIHKAMISSIHIEFHQAYSNYFSTMEKKLKLLTEQELMTTNMLKFYLLRKEADLNKSESETRSKARRKRVGDSEDIERLKTTYITSI